MIAIAHPQIGPEEQEAVAKVLASGQLAQGKQVEEFERRFAELCGVSEAVAVSSGTAALHVALLAHGIGAGDEVITTPFSFAATGNTILLVGATPVFVDIEPDTLNIDPAQVEAAITPRTKAIMPVHLYGNPADMDRLMAIAERHHLAMIEDACQAHAAGGQLRHGLLFVLSDEEHDHRRGRHRDDQRRRDCRAGAALAQPRAEGALSPYRHWLQLPHDGHPGGDWRGADREAGGVHRA